ncbi:MAG: type VI secretion system baseplate subunit TssK [Gemmataceae bacterium]|nr:type VI secretion system baseplate subunit TssK [Gemmataceae bacterium]
MTQRPVHWHEGMFMGPQHLQAAARHDASQRRLYSRAAVRYNWGLARFRLNLPALANHRFEPLELVAFLRDGTALALPDDGAMPAAGFQAEIEQSFPVLAWLALPSFAPGRSNAAEGIAADTRWLLDTQAVEDENAESEPQPVRFRLANPRLLVSNAQEQPGFDILPLARLTRTSDASVTPKLDEDYIPPLVCCDAWEPLQVGILRTIYDRIGTKINVLAGQVASRGISLESQAGEDVRILGQLRILNEAWAVLHVLSFAEGVHPLEAYLELARVVGQLSIYGSTHRPPEIPSYDHDDLGYIFNQLKKHLDALLDLILEPEWQARPFIGAGKRMQVALESAWLEARYQMFIGVKSNLPPDQCANLFTNTNALDMKIGSSDRVDALFDRGQTGLRFTHATQPRSLPMAAGLTYFQVDRQSQANEWQAVGSTHTLAIRLNERLVQGSIHEKQELSVLHKGSTVPVQLTLYVIRPMSSAAP